MEDFLQGIIIPPLTENDKMELDAPVTLVEVRRAVAGIPNQKSPGPDGLPTEIYK